MPDSQHQQSNATPAQTDHAGERYWSEVWDAHELPGLWRVDSDRIGDYVDRSVFAHLKQALQTHLPDVGAVRVLEAGCARSAVLPLLKRKLGYDVAGIDYSPTGCEQARRLLLNEGVQGEVHCSDIFSPPGHLVESFDAVVSFGLIEHFSDTAGIVRALARFLRPGGVIFTNVPNMRGITGFTQRMFDRDVYEIHVPLTDLDVRSAHEKAGLDISQCKYFLPVNLGVVNLNSLEKRTAQWWVKKVVLAALVRMSMAAWWWDRTLKPLPATRALSPYIHCVAIKTART